MYFRKNNILLIILIITILSGVVSCKKGKSDKDKSDETIFAVNVTPAVKGQIQDYIELNGNVKSKTEISVYPEVFGKLRTIDVKVGDFIHGQNSASPTIIGFVDPSKPGMTYKWSPIRSPISGTITEILSQIGATVTQQVPVVKVGKLDDIEIECFVAEKFISHIRTGLDVFVYLYAYPGESFAAKVSEMSPVLDPTSRMLELSISMMRNDNRIKPGMFAKLKIVTEKKNKIVKIPVECLISRFGIDYVFILDDGDTTSDTSVSKKVVLKGIEIDEQVEILEGLNGGEKVVMTGQNLLDNDSKVKVVKEKTPLSSIQQGDIN